MNIERIKSIGFGIEKADDKFKEIHFTRRPLGPKDILIEIVYAGICHSDLHTIKQHWGDIQHFPLIPGHEIVGKVIKIGDSVLKFKEGDYAGIGCMVNSCKECPACKSFREQDCKKAVLTYGSRDWTADNEWTQGGYSTNYVVNQDFAICVNKDKVKDMSKIPSLMCAGITTYSPIKQANVEEDMICGVLGLGGLGHMAVQYLQAINCKVIAFDNKDKEDFANKLGIGFVNINDGIDESLYKKFDFIISTIPYKYDLNTYLPLMKYNGNFAIVGLPPHDECPDLNLKDMILKYPGVRIWGSQIGGIAETQECVDFSIEHNIYPIVKEIEATPEAINKAYEEMLNGNIDGRFVIDIKSLNNKLKQ